jgi:hypothetical protein
MLGHDMRKLLYFSILFLLFSGKTGRSGPAYDIDDLKVRVLSFEERHDKFVRKLFGCPETGIIVPSDCRPAHGIVSYGDFISARKRAAKLYSLEE